MSVNEDKVISSVKVWTNSNNKTSYEILMSFDQYDTVENVASKISKVSKELIQNLETNGCIVDGLVKNYYNVKGITRASITTDNQKGEQRYIIEGDSPELVKKEFESLKNFGFKDPIQDLNNKKD